MKEKQKADQIALKKAPKTDINYDKLDLKCEAKIDLRGKPAISFDLNSRGRKITLGIIQSNSNKKQDIELRNEVIEKIGQEFARIYRRYRNLLQDYNGNVSRYTMQDDCLKYCEKIGVSCIQNGITPRQLLEYWSIRIVNFAEGVFQQKFPTLPFLSSSYAIEQVVVAVFENTQGKAKHWRPGDFEKEAATQSSVHSFFNTNELDKRLKVGLFKAGFITDGNGCKYDDRFLLTVQKTAIAISAGKDVFCGGELKKMVEWALVNLYCASEDSTQANSRQ
jgi:hypothetical protein